VVTTSDPTGLAAGSQPAEPVVGMLEEVWSSIADLCAGLAPDDWDRPTDCPGWSVRDHVSHMIGTERMLLGEQPPPFEGPRPAHVRNDIGQANEAWVEARRGLPGHQVLAEFREVTARRLAELRSFGPDRFDRVGPSPVGQVPYREFMDVRVFDCWVHEQDIRRAVGRPGGRHGVGEARALARMADLMGYVVGRRVAPPEGTVVRWQITGPLGRTLTVAQLGGRGAPVEEPPAPPAVTIVLDAGTFLRLACGRTSGAGARAAGDVGLEGDVSLGAEVLGAMNVMI